MRRLLHGTVPALTGVSMLCAGCAASRPAPPRVAPASLPSASELEAVLSARRQAVHSLRALARMRYHDPTLSNSSREAVAVARPDRLRVEVLSLFGAVFVLITDNGKVTAYARREDTVYRGSASPENMQRYAHIGLPVSDLIDIVLGTPPAGPGRSAVVSFDAGSGAVRLWRDLADGAQGVWFDAGVPVAAEHRDADGEVRWRATFDSHREVAGVPIATRIRLEIPFQQRWVEIELADIDLNPVLDGAVFAFQAPPGSTVVDIDRIAD